MEFRESLGRVSIPRRPAAALVGRSSQADLRMVAAALSYALSSRLSKAVSPSSHLAVQRSAINVREPFSLTYS